MKGNIKWILPYFFPVKGLVIFTALLLVIGSLSSFVTIGLQQTIIDTIIIDGNYDLLTKTLIYMGIAFVVGPVVFTFGPHLIHLSVAKVTEDASKDFIQYMYNIPSEKLQTERTGKYVHNIVFDSEQIAVLIGNDVPRIINEVLAVFILLFIIGINSPVILLFSLASVVIYIFLGHYFSKRVKKATKDVQRTKSDLIIHMEEGVASTREVIAYHRMKWEKAIYDRVFQSYFHAVMKEGKVVNAQLIGSEPIRWGITIFILAYGGYLVLQGQMSLGVFIIIYQFSNQLLGQFQALFTLALGLSEKMACVERVRNVIDAPPWNDGADDLQEDVSSLQLENIQFNYGQASHNNVLDNFNLSLPIGKKVALVGSSGAGKSTVAQLLIRAFEPAYGALLVNGRPLSEVKRKDWSDRVAVVFQDPYLYPDTIRNNILMGSQADDVQIFEACKVAQIHDYILSLPDQYDTVIGERGITLSGGQRQRIAIARALIRDPEILILDEATSSLDVITEKKLQQKIDTFRKGKTTIIIAHRLSTIQNADYIYVLDEGQVVEAGTHTELMKNMSTYQSLVLLEDTM